MKRLIIVPAYNEEENIEHTVEDILGKSKHFDYVVINDCSTDRTKEICESHQYNIINLPINLGIGGAVQTGYQYAAEHGYDMAVQVDGDGQHDPEFLEKMADYLEKNQLDMVIGSRFIEKSRDSLFYKTDSLVNRENHYRSHIGFKNDRKKCTGNVRKGLSERLPGTGKCGRSFDAWT